METAKANAVKEFKDSHAFIDSCAEYYGVGFEDCLKLVKSNYPDLDLAKISMDGPLPITLAGNTVPKETDDSIELNQDTQDNGFVLAQPALNPSVVPLTPSANPTTTDDLLAQDAPVLLQGDEAPKDPPTS